jgi:hypothetical protein
MIKARAAQVSLDKRALFKALLSLLFQIAQQGSPMGLDSYA